KWCLPEGKIEPGETPETAAKREVYEETNLTIRDLEKAGNYSGEILIKEQEKTSIGKIKFFELGEIWQIDTTEATRHFLEKLASQKASACEIAQ
ncbi:1241_t:CDS:2, partial [Ambispora gerdemannii]